MDIYPNQCLIFLKYFDINEKKLMKVQKFTIDDTEKPLIHYAPLFNEIADLPINTPLNIYEETYPTMIDLLNQNHSFKKLEIVDGDILCFEKKLASEEEYDNIDKHLMIIPQYFEKLLSQKVVTFINNETFFDLKKRLLKKISLSNRELNEDNIYLINKESRLIKCDDDDVPDKYIAVGYDCPERTLMPLLSDKGLNINMKS
ncbi:ICP0-binding domain of ubiquitin-specific protease 7-domain-containing protein [Neocallimastix sp. 'constans']